MHQHRQHLLVSLMPDSIRRNGLNDINVLTYQQYMSAHNILLCKQQLASVSLHCKSRCFKTANYKNFIRKFNAQKLAITFISVSGLS